MSVERIRDEVLASVAVLTLSGVLVYAYKHAKDVTKIASSNDSFDLGEKGNQEDVYAVGSTVPFNAGPSFYVANTPYLFGASVGNVLPNTSYANTSGGPPINQTCLGCSDQSN